MRARPGTRGIDPIPALTIDVGAYEELNAAYVKLFGLVMAQVDPADIAGAAQGELEEISLGGSRCVRIHHRGSYDRLAESIDALYAYAMTNIDQELGASAPYIHHWDDPDEVPEAELRSDVYLPLVAAPSKFFTPRS